MAGLGVTAWVDGDVEKLAVAVTLALESCGLAVSVLEALSFIERTSELAHLKISASQSELQRLEFTR